MKNYKRKNRLTASEYIDGVLKGDRVLLSRAITIVESNLESDKKLAKGNNPSYIAKFRKVH